MICQQCNGTGTVQLPHLPSITGGWIDEKYIFSGIECGTCNGSGYISDWDSDDSPVADFDYSDSPVRETRPPTAEEQFAEHSTQLITALRFSSFLPTHLIQRWIRKIKEINICQPAKGLVILDELFAGYWCAADEFKPQRDIFDLAIAKTMEFDNEMDEIKQELDWLEVILKHVEDYLKHNPFKRK